MGGIELELRLRHATEVEAPSERTTAICKSREPVQDDTKDIMERI